MTDPVTSFLEADQQKWIFPLRTPVVLAQADAKSIREHIQLKLLDSAQKDGFVTGQVAYSRKDVHHLRRVFVLDPFATFFLYDFVHRNRKSFSKSEIVDRHVYGHSFRKGQSVDGFAEYHAFRKKKYELIAKHGYFGQLDIFNCFNSFYHHELESFISAKIANADGDNFGQFLRELNAGVSVACFPQGLYPAKVIGNAYLSFIEQSRKLRSPGIARFLDDIVLANQSLRGVEEDILELQYVLDKHHLSLNDSKTLVGAKGQRFQERKLDSIKRALLVKRVVTKVTYDGEDGDDEEAEGLSEAEREFCSH